MIKKVINYIKDRTESQIEKEKRRIKLETTIKEEEAREKEIKENIEKMNKEIEEQREIEASLREINERLEESVFLDLIEVPKERKRYNVPKRLQQRKDLQRRGGKKRKKNARNSRKIKTQISAVKEFETIKKY